MYYHYGIPKYERSDKLSGIYRHKVLEKRIPLLRGFDDWFYAPHSRYTEALREDIEKVPELMILAESGEATNKISFKETDEFISICVLKGVF